MIHATLRRVNDIVPTAANDNPPLRLLKQAPNERNLTK
jgi:hypothetical protein